VVGSAYPSVKSRTVTGACFPCSYLTWSNLLSLTLTLALTLARTPTLDPTPIPNLTLTLTLVLTCPNS